MCSISSPYLVRLQELKSWQESLDKALPPSEPKVNNRRPPIMVSPKNSIVIDWDKQIISPSKPFDELLEEKLAEDILPATPITKRKRPFLKKGSGLARYALDPKSYLLKKQGVKKKETLKDKFNTEPAEEIQNRIHVEIDNDIDDSPIPLEIPEAAIKSKGTWITVNSAECLQETSSHKVKEKNLEKISESPKTTYNDEEYDLQKTEEKFSFFEPDMSEKELRLFETLEEKVQHTSFSPSNSSIIKLFSSTPTNKPNSRRRLLIDEPSTKYTHSDILARLFQNLKLLSNKNQNATKPEADAVKCDASNSCLDTETGKWSCNSDSRPQSSVSFYTDFEHTLEKRDLADAAVNTSLEEKYSTAQALLGQCIGCIELQRKLKRMEEETPNIIAEKAKLCDFAKELERKRDLLKEEMDLMKRRYEKDISDLQEELENHKQTYARDKKIFDAIQKDNYPSKRERDNIEALKRELVEIKELMKLKDTKNGTTQARLRNQIKHLEKDKNELLTSLENLKKDNAKLKASKTIDRNKAETKMLQEINKNLHRLTEETKHLQRIEVSCSENNKESNQEKYRRKSMGDFKEDTEKESQARLNKTTNICQTNREVLSGMEAINNNQGTGIDVEKIYLSTFGVNTVSATNSMNNELNKENLAVSEINYPDGRNEIRYSNGITKTTSPCGNIIYLQYPNGNKKEINLIDNSKKYFISDKGTWITKYTDGTEVLQCSNGQIQKKSPDGKLEVSNRDGTLLTRFPNGYEEIIYPNGSKVVKSDGQKILYLPNGEIETQTKDFVKREYPSGTIKILYPDGKQITKFVNGRVRVKDADGAILADSKASVPDL